MYIFFPFAKYWQALFIILLTRYTGIQIDDVMRAFLHLSSLFFLLLLFETLYKYPLV